MNWINAVPAGPSLARTLTLALTLSMLPQLALAQTVAGMPDAAASARSPEALRDPSAWPAAVKTPANAAADGSVTDPALRLQQIVVKDGRAYVVANGRLWPVGAKLGDATIVRIEESAVWLKDSSGTRRESLYPGIEKRAAADLSVPRTKPPHKYTSNTTTKAGVPRQEAP
ncbi:hypothetical protein PRZ01_04500 [Paucibacter sp. hw1]|uniref:MSHA biogenesis protein MshK n=1 Tax=Roseateles koreensis TaxID=2987526 RepID=A0ABT5KRP5_9BURK|nr:hypothetical protein [Roseateles koreensis]